MRVIENKHSNRDWSMTDLQGECRYRLSEEEEEEEEVQRRMVECVLLISTPALT